jgi:hypothetical protein
MLGKVTFAQSVDHKPFTVTLVAHILLVTQDSLERRDSSKQARFTIGTFETCISMSRTVLNCIMIEG